MSGLNQLGRIAAGLLAFAVGVFLSLHISIGAAYGGGSGESVTAFASGALIVLALITMWTFGRPRSLWARTAACAALTVGYFTAFTVVV